MKKNVKIPHMSDMCARKKVNFLCVSVLCALFEAFFKTKAARLLI
jgi:hypothetical protein